MKLHRLDHVNIRTAQLGPMVEFYERILGLRAGARPDFGFPGAWLYLDEHPIVHLVGVEQECASVDPKIEHFAIEATGLKEFISRLEAAGIAHAVRPVPGYPILQVNFRDVDGNHIHVDFNSGEADSGAG
ncbi:MAG: glyoxalase [Rhodobacteraceae bacterium]|nr:VOC family protein [Boseongicola sp.]NNF24648.1 glyoxalase [Paracoccaceae bacterium]